MCHAHRVLLDPTANVGSPVTAERTLLQPFNFLLAVERSLCPWNTSIPAISINLNMERLKVGVVETYTFVFLCMDQLICVTWLY